MKLVFTSLLVALTSVAVWAQCDPDPTITSPGLYPPDDTCATIGEYVEFVYQFKNYDQVTQPLPASVDSIRFDSLSYLPCGLQWETSNADNIYTKNENGCIRIWGYPSASNAVGEYTVKIVVSAWINNSTGGAVQQPASALGITMKLRVVDGSTACTATLNDVQSACEAPVGLNEVERSVSTFKASPNPFSTYTNISFTANRAANYTFKVYNTLGKVVYQQPIEATEGINSVRFDRDGLSAGVYLYSLTNGTDAITNSMIITE